VQNEEAKFASVPKPALAILKLTIWTTAHHWGTINNTHKEKAFLSAPAIASKQLYSLDNLLLKS
jgi:hypothetical protein